MVKNNRKKVFFCLIDIFFILIAIICGIILHPKIDCSFLVILSEPVWEYFRVFTPLTLSIRLFALYFFGVYELQKGTPAYKSLEKIFKATTFGTLGVFIIIHTLRSYYFFDIGLSRYTCLIEWTMNILLLLGWRVFYFNTWPKVHLKEGRTKNTIILGIDEDSLSYLTESNFNDIKRIPFQYWNIVGYYTFNKNKESLHCREVSLKCLDNYGNFLELVNRFEIENVILADSESSSEQMNEFIEQCYALGVRVFISPRLYHQFAGKLKLRPMESMPIFEVIWEPIYGFNRVLKRIFDVLFSLVAITITFPVMIIIAFVIKVTSKGPILFKQVRIGKDNKPFMIYKFRSMIENAEGASGPMWAEDNDPRVTKVGKFLRKTSLDELPQLFLVLLGKISIVGPRPERPHFVYKYKDFQGLRLCIKPGLTGLAQINGRYNANLSDKIYNDMYYINNYSFYLDLVIVVKTFWSVLTGQGAR